MNWLDLHPDDLIERFEPNDALERLRQQPKLTPEQMRKLDVYLHHWTLVLLQRSNDPDGVQDMLTLCEIAGGLATEGAANTALQQRWSGFEDLLEGKRRQLLANLETPPIQLKQQDTILKIIELSDSGRVKQQELAERLQLSKGRVSQILGVLESRALIARQRQGKESWVSLIGATPSMSPVRGKLTPSSAPVQIGRDVFAKAA